MQASTNPFQLHLSIKIQLLRKILSGKLEKKQINISMSANYCHMNFHHHFTAGFFDSLHSCEKRKTSFLRSDFQIMDVLVI
jgi:hypothetical protein